jgi:two-component sensor histidine kinase
MSQTSGKAPIVEPTRDGSSPLESTERALRQRVRQQEILAQLGVIALKGASFTELLDHTACLTAEGLEAEFCKVLEYLPQDNRLLVRSGVGWGEGVVGSASIGADLESPAGFALHTGKPVISNHLENEERFRTPELLVQHGIRRALNVILQGDGSPFGVLEVDSRSEGEFGEQDIAFLQGAANVLGMAIERQRYERHLEAALEHQQVLLKEINHRAKNSLQLVASMLDLQGKAINEPKLSEHLMQASSRVAAVGRLYERLSHEADIERIDLGSYLRDVCKDLAETGSHCEINIEAPTGIQFAPDRAIHLALIVNELVTNACKYAYPDNSKTGQIWVHLRQEGDTVSVSMWDEGIGLPPGFDFAKSTGLGMRIVMGLARQLGAIFAPTQSGAGTRFILRVPMEHTSHVQGSAHKGGTVRPQA